METKMNMINVTNKSHDASLVWLDQTGFVIKCIQGALIFLFNSAALVICLTLRKIKYSNVLYSTLFANNLLVAFILVPLSTLHDIFSRWPTADFFCFLYYLALLVNYAFSSLTMLILNVHRYLMCNKPYDINDKLSRKKLANLCVPLTVTLVLAALLLMLLMRDQLNFESCTLSLSFSVALAIESIAYILPLILALLFNLFNLVELCFKYKFKRITKAKDSIFVHKKNISQRRESNTRRVHFKADIDVYCIQTDNENGPNKNPIVARDSRTLTILNRKKRFASELKIAVCNSTLLVCFLSTQLYYYISWPFSAGTKSTSFQVSFLLTLLFPLLSPVIWIGLNCSPRVHSLKLISTLKAKSTN